MGEQKKGGRTQFDSGGEILTDRAVRVETIEKIRGDVERLATQIKASNRQLVDLIQTKARREAWYERYKKDFDVVVKKLRAISAAPDTIISPPLLTEK